jgi:phosphoesterase RecJ-like protein
MYDMQHIRDIINNNDTFIITAHINPDGDAVGSSLGLALSLRGIGKNVKVVLNNYSQKYLHLPGMEMVCEGVEDGCELGGTVLICLDCANKERLFTESRFGEFKQTVNIDHHISNTSYADVNYIYKTAASAGEVILELLDGYFPINRDIADVLLLALLSDTGGLSHNNTNGEALHHTAKLIGLGADIAKIKKRILNYRTMAEVKLFKTALHNIEMRYNNAVAVSYLTANDFCAAQAAYADTEGIPEYMLEIENAAVALLFTERDDGRIKVNFRSMNVNVSEIAAIYGGGGHVNAAGATVEGNVHHVLETVTARVWDEIRGVS